MIFTSLCKNHPVDGWLHNILSRLVKRDYVALFYTMREDYVFDGAKAACVAGKPIVVLDFSETGYSDSWNNSHLLGFQPEHGRELKSKTEYDRLNSWLSRQNVVTYFKRELTPDIRALEKVPFPIYPVDLLAQYFTPDSYNKDHWMSRLGGVFHLYGHSHQDRKILHGELQARWDHTINSLGAMSASITRGEKFHLLEQVEWFNRYPMDFVTASQSGCKLAVALPGFGVKTFRNSEVCQSGIPVVADLRMEFAVPWTKENSILLPTVDGRLDIPASVAILERALQDPEALYPVFEQATHASRQLHPDYFVEHFINQPILRHL